MKKMFILIGIAALLCVARPLWVGIVGQEIGYIGNPFFAAAWIMYIIVAAIWFYND